MKKYIKDWRIVITFVLSATMLIIALITYNSYIEHRIVEESTKHLTEVYSQMKDTFKVWVERNWNLLYTWKSDLETLNVNTKAQTEEEKEQFYRSIRKIFTERREKWKFSEFLFIDAEGKYVTCNGKNGSVELTDKQWHLIEGPGDYVINVTVDGIEYVMFVKSTLPDSIYGFEYEYTAILYSLDATMDVMNVESFDGNARCYITYADGECMFCDSHSSNCPDNLLNDIEKTGSLSQKELVRVKDDFDKNRTGNVIFSKDGEKAYLVYVPTEVRDCMMAGVVPKSIANHSMNYVQNLSLGTAMLVALVLLAVIAIGFILNRRHLINEKNTKIMSLQQMFDILVENTDNVFFMFSGDTFEIEYISSNAAKVLGIIDEEYIEKLTKITELKIDGDQVVSKEMIKGLGEGKARRTSVGYRHEQTGEMRWYMRGLYCADKGDEKYVLTLCDRTKEQENNMHIKDALDLAKSANKAKSGFLSNVSHDIRTPMNAIIGLTALIQRDYNIPEKVERYAGKIAVSSKHLLDIINNVLDMSKIESGKTTLNVKKFKLKDLVDGVTDVIYPQVKAKEQEFEILCDDNLRAEYIGDITRINQILLNLLSNSVKYTDEGGRILLHFYETSDLSVSDNYAELCFDVTDNGCGMAPEYIESVFEPFSRENNERTEKVDGAGLGLALVKNIVDLMGGTISVESEPGHGTTFHVKIILRAAESSLPQMQSVNEETDEELIQQSEITKEKNVKVLIAEDYELNAEILVELLKAEGFDVDVSCNGKEAVEMFVGSEPFYYDYILMDVQMPLMNGYTATKAIRELDRPDAKLVKIIAMTANAFAEDVQKALDSGMDAHVAKPIDMEVLKEAMIIRK